MFRTHRRYYAPDTGILNAAQKHVKDVVSRYCLGIPTDLYFIAKCYLINYGTESKVISKSVLKSGSRQDVNYVEITNITTPSNYSTLAQKSVSHSLISFQGIFPRR